ncbi:MAG: T9SS type A sorting domain-containing protein [Bacteroidota bacterium]
MRKINKPTYLVILLMTTMSVLWAQPRVVDIPDNGDPVTPVDIFPFIMGDTTEMGARVDTNTIYTLENGVVYFSSDRLVNKPSWTLHLRAKDLENTDQKPIITRIPDDLGERPKIAYPEGDMILENLWIIGGENGPGESHDWGQIRLLGENTRHVVKDCILEKDRGGFLQLRADGVKLFVDNCILRNGGNRFILEGNGRGIDSRNFSFDSLVVTNTVIHNIIDRVFRSIGNTIPHNYIEFDHNTIFNVAGRHGYFNFEWVRVAKVTNNLLINPIMLGTTPALTDEQNQPDNESHKIFTVDTVTSETQFQISNNNIFYTQDVIDVWAKHDTVSRPEVYSALMKQVMGADTANSFIEEVIELKNVPIPITQYIDDLYADPSSTEMFDFVVEDSAVAGTALDFGNLFNFANFDPCYDSGAQSASASTDGGGIGKFNTCTTQSTSIASRINEDLLLNIFPNPLDREARVSFTLRKPGHVNIQVVDMFGRVVEELTNRQIGVGEHTQQWELKDKLAAGMYMVKLETVEGAMVQKVLVR